MNIKYLWGKTLFPILLSFHFTTTAVAQSVFETVVPAPAHLGVNVNTEDVPFWKTLDNDHQDDWDERVLHYPADWRIAKGNDGRWITFPHGWKHREGSDGRIVAYPSSFYTQEGDDGRVIAYPYSKWRYFEGGDGRGVAIPRDWDVDENGNSLWGKNIKAGSDNRKIVVPPGWESDQGGDSRLIAYPAGWLTDHAFDKRLIAIPPLSPWKTTWGRDGRMITYHEGITSRVVEGNDDRKVAITNNWYYRSGPDGRIKQRPKSTIKTPLTFDNPAQIALMKKLKEDVELSDEEYHDYLLYIYLNKD
ncbi:hypothetical protein [Microbulbifer sp. GL-2]|uniref:hypothetical protein n=1 Tax=Microbulbifer sp. GL-2 TaxID=2591606 RepID=UPI0011659764|nr:hypothetical protein [Microbulbifer sp. GL-2]BBM03031.1 hypothetical protein GL2_31050 [Microbulbifer sp. GL-2]